VTAAAARLEQRSAQLQAVTAAAARLEQRSAQLQVQKQHIDY
jgi:hypothetical protein